MIFTWRGNSGINEGLLTKTPLEFPFFVVDFQDAIPPGVTLSTASTGALNVNGAYATSYAVGTCTISGTTVKQSLLSCGSNGVSAAVNNSRFKVTTTVVLSNGEQVAFNTYVFVTEGAPFDPGA